MARCSPLSCGRKIVQWWMVGLWLCGPSDNLSTMTDTVLQGFSRLFLNAIFRVGTFRKDKSSVGGSKRDTWLMIWNDECRSHWEWGGLGLQPRRSIKNEYTNYTFDLELRLLSRMHMYVSPWKSIDEINSILKPVDDWAYVRAHLRLRKCTCIMVVGSNVRIEKNYSVGEISKRHFYTSLFYGCVREKFLENVDFSLHR